MGALDAEVWGLGSEASWRWTTAGSHCPWLFPLHPPGTLRATRANCVLSSHDLFAIHSLLGPAGPTLPSVSWGIAVIWESILCFPGLPQCVLSLCFQSSQTGRTELRCSKLWPHQHPLQVKTVNKSHLSLDVGYFAPNRCSGKTYRRTEQTDGTVRSFINYFQCRERLLWDSSGSEALHNCMLIKI